MPSLVRDKSGVFFIVYSKGGKRVWRSTKTKDRSKAYRAFLAAESLTTATTKAEKNLSHHIDDYLRHVRVNHGAKTGDIYELALGHFLRSVGDVPIDSITPRMIDMFKIERSEHTSPATVNNNLRAVRTFFNCLKRWEVISKNPCDEIDQVHIPERLPSYLTISQLQHLIGTIKDQWITPIILFAAMTGARLGEILNLTWDRVDMTSRTALIESSISYQVKCGKIRAIPLNETAYAVLASLPHRQGLVFRGKRGGHANANHVSGKFREAARKAGLDKRLHFHSLRHTFASLLVQNGVSLYQVQKLLGHSSARVTEVYAHLQNPLLHDVVNTINIPSPKSPGSLATRTSEYTQSKNSPANDIAVKSAVT